jgi:hypothetical protein
LVGINDQLEIDDLIVVIGIVFVLKLIAEPKSP